MPEQIKLSILIPSFNEARTLPKIIRQILDLGLNQPYEIIVVNDGSTDKTASILKNFNHQSLKIITNSRNLGKGASIIKALNFARGDIILIQDADLEYSPKEIPVLLKPFSSQNVQVVYGSRVLKNNPVSHWTFNLGGRLTTFITNMLYNTHITDEPTGYKLFKRDLLKKFNLRSKGFEFCPEITAKIAKAGIKIHEVPISYKPRPVSQKKIKWHDGLTAIYYLVKYRFLN